MNDDLISRQEALNIRFSDAINEDGVLYVPLRDFTNGLKTLPPAQPEQRWIPCSERLPSEKDGQVLATKCGEVRIATYSEFSGIWYVGEMCSVGGEDPIAWMPLPEPWEGKEE